MDAICPSGCELVVGSNPSPMSCKFGKSLKRLDAHLSLLTCSMFLAKTMDGSSYLRRRMQLNVWSICRLLARYHLQPTHLADLRAGFPACVGVSIGGTSVHISESSSAATKMREQFAGAFCRMPPGGRQLGRIQMFWTPNLRHNHDTPILDYPQARPARIFNWFCTNEWVERWKSGNCTECEQDLIHIPPLPNASRAITTNNPNRFTATNKSKMQELLDRNQSTTTNKSTNKSKKAEL